MHCAFCKFPWQCPPVLLIPPSSSQAFPSINIQFILTSCHSSNKYLSSTYYVLSMCGSSLYSMNSYYGTPAIPATRLPLSVRSLFGLPALSTTLPQSISSVNYIQIKVESISYVIKNWAKFCPEPSRQSLNSLNLFCGLDESTKEAGVTLLFMIASP